MTKRSSTSIMSSMNQRGTQAPVKNNPQTPGVNTGANGKQDDVKLVHDKANPNALTLNVQGKKVVLNEAELTQLLQPYQRGKDPKKETSAANAQALSQHGIKSSQDIIAYLNSPGGKAKQALVQEQLSILVALKQQSAADIYRRELLKQLFLANARRTILSKRKAEMRAVIAANERQNKESIAASREASARSSSTAPTYTLPDEDLRRYLLRSYDLALQDIEDELRESLDEAQKLEDEIAAHMAHGERIKVRFGIIHTHTDNLDAHSRRIENLPPQERIAVTQLGLGQIHLAMATLTSQILQHAYQGEDAQADQLMDHLDGLSIEAEGMQVMLDQMHSRCHYFTEEGHRTDAYHMTAYVVPSHQHIHKDKATGQLYLLKAGQKFEGMTTEEKAIARQKFEQVKPEFYNAKDRAKHYYDSEMSEFESTTSTLADRSEEMQKQILTLTNQHNSLKALRASVITQLDEAKSTALPMPTPNATPLPKPAPSATPSPRPGQTEVTSQFAPAQSYRHILQLMRINPSQESIDRFKSGFVLPNGEPNRAVQEAIATSIKPGMPILLTTMNSLLANLERLGVSTNKPSVTSIPSKHPQRVENQKPEESPGTTPTPFSTTPSPFNKY